MITLLSVHSRFLCAEVDGKVFTNRIDAGPWEHWFAEKQDNGKYAFKSWHNKYLCYDAIAHKVIANRTVVGEWEQFTIEILEQGIALKTFDGHYITAELDGTVACNRTELGSWETWTDFPSTFFRPEAFLVVLPKLKTNKQNFELADGKRFTAIQCSDFNLFNRFQKDEDITSILKQRKDARMSMLRVWTLYNLDGIGICLNPNYNRIGPFLDLCARYGLYVEFTAYTSTFDVFHWNNLVSAVYSKTNVLLELVNENDIAVNTVDTDSYIRPTNILCSHGSNGSEQWPVKPHWDYLTFHTNGAFEEQRKVGHNAMEISDSLPALTNETSRYPEVGFWRREDHKRNLNLAYDSAAGASLLCAGSCFHSVLGKTSELWDEKTLEVATAWANGALSIPLEAQHQAYYHQVQLETEGLLRVYQRGGDVKNVAKIRV